MSFASTFDNLSINGYKAQTPTYSTVQILTASDSSNNDLFGSDVAFSNLGNYLAIGANRAANFAGKVYVYQKNNSSYNNEQILSAANGAPNDFFGGSIDINGDGNILAIGAAGYSNGKGAAYIFTRTGNSWTEANVLTASDAANNDNFGDSIALNKYGNYLAIGAPTEDTSPRINNGAVYIFTRSGNVWTQQAKLTDATPSNSAAFGRSVAISDDGTYLFVGSPDDAPTGVVTLFVRSGNSWGQKNSVSLGIASQDAGISLATNSNGNIIFTNSQNAPNEFFVLTRSGNTLSLTQTISMTTVANLITNNGRQDEVSCDANGTIAACGLFVPDKTVVFNRPNSSNVNLQINQILTPTNSTSNQETWSTAVSSDGSIIAVGSVDNTAPAGPGQVYVYFLV